MTDIPEPSFEQTFRWADGDDVGEFGWMTTDDQFRLDVEDENEPRDVLVETWQRVSADVITMFPPLVSCSYYDSSTTCEEDAVCWQQEDGHWMQACAVHKHR